MTPENTSSVRFSPRHPSGIDVIDDTWGGIYRGGAYLLYGQAMSGRGLLALMMAREGFRSSEDTLFISSDRQREVFIQAASIGFDLQGAFEAGGVRLIRIPTLAESRDQDDDHVASAINDLVEMIARFAPDRVVINDFVPFVAFHSYERFQFEFVRFLERADSVGATLVLVMPEPVSDESRRVIEFMQLQVTGTVHIELAEEHPRSTRRRLSLIPRIGHIRHRIVDYWDLEDIVDESLDTFDAVAEVQKSAPPPVKRKEESGPVEAMNQPIQVTVPEPPESTPDFSDRSEFAAVLEPLFAARESGETPFLLLAMKMDRSRDRPVGPFDFDFLMDLVQQTLKSSDELFVDLENERLIVCLADSSPKDAQSFFARLKRSLRKESPSQADHLLHNVSAIVVPNGLPFKSVDDFMKYALNES